MKEPSNRVWVVFAEAMEINDLETRAAYVVQACVGDAELRNEVEELLQAEASSGEFLTGRARKSLAALSEVGWPAPEKPLSEAGLGDRIGAYKLVEKLGEGGCGVVYLAEQEHPVRRKVALKLIKPGMDTRSVISRFGAERQALAMMDHAGIAKVFDAGATRQGRPFFAMEWVPGIKLTQFCDERRFSIRARLEIFVRVCQAVQHAHQKGVIHRDLKPSNILVLDQDGVAVPKIIDFGIAKATRGQALTEGTLVTGREQVIGTPAYMSPEQATLSGLDVDTRSDIYSLGVLLYELLTGTTPFEARRLQQAGLDELRRIIREEGAIRPSTRYQHLGPEQRARVARNQGTEPPKLLRLIRGDLEWIIMKALEKDPNRRYATVNALGMDVQRYLRNEPILARPPDPLYRLRKVAQQHKVGFAAGAAVLGALVLGLALSLWQAARATRAELAQVALREQAQLSESIARKAQAAEAEQTHVADQARRQAEADRTRLARALNQVELQRIEGFFSAGDGSKALAYLASLLRREPDNEVAAERLFSALSLRDFPLRIIPSLPHHSRVLYARFSPTGNLVATAADDGTVQVWDALTGLPTVPPLRHHARVWFVEFSPDGTRLATASDDRTARIWNARTGDPVTPPLTHADYLSCARFSPDGQWVVTASDDHTARVWHAQTGAPVGPPLRHGDHVSSAGFSPDGQFVVTSSDDKTARVWNARTGEPLAGPLRHEGRVWYAEFSPDGRLVVTASDDKTARIWDAHTGRPMADALRHSAGVMSARFSPEGLRVVTASDDGSAQLWDARTGKAIAPPLRHQAKIRSAEFSPDGQKVVTASEDRTARIWDALTGQQLSEPMRHEAAVRFAQFSPDGQKVITASEDRTAQVWDARIDQLLTEPLGHEDILTCACFSPDGQRILTGSEDGTARLWDARTLNPLFEPSRHEDAVTCARFSPDGQRVVTASKDGTIRVWDARTGAPLTERLRHGGRVYSAQFSPDGKRVLSAAEEGEARIWEVVPNPGSPLRLKHVSPIMLAEFSPDGLLVLIGMSDGAVQLCDARTGLIAIPLPPHANSVTAGQFALDGSKAATGSLDGSARVWDTSTRRLICQVQHRDRVSSVSFSADGKRLLTASWDGTVRIWDAQSGQPLTEPLEHRGRVTSAQFSADGLRVVTASDDRSALVWDSLTGLPVTERLKHSERVVTACFSPDGQKVLTASDDKTARVWDVPSRLTPVPLWILELTEALVADRVNDHRVLESVSMERLEALRVAAQTGQGNDIWTRWGKWFFADPLTRQISPFSHLTMIEYVDHRIRQNTVESLREAIRIAPTNAAALAGLASSLVSAGAGVADRDIAEAEWYSARAVQFAPDQPEPWVAKARVLEVRGDPSAAVENMRQALRLEPENPVLWSTQAALLEDDNRPDEAYESLTRAIGLAQGPASKTNLVAALRLSRSNLMKRQNRLEEAAADFTLAAHISPRPPEASAQQIDLSLNYNASLDETWHQGGEKNDLSPVPRGLQMLAGVTFDIRGLIQVGAESRNGVKYPSEISLQVGQTCQRVNFLHSAIHCYGLPKGTRIGTYRVHYRGDKTAEIPIVIGLDVADWWNQPDEQNDHFLVAWEGTNERTRALGRTIRLFKSVWVNPAPELEIERIDFLSTYEHAAPFLIAVTLE